MKTQSARWRRPSANASSFRCHVVDLGTGGPTARRLVLSEGSSFRLVPVHHILWAEARGGRVSLYSSDGHITISGVLMTLTHALGAGFQQISRNTIVNMTAVTELRRRSRRGESAVVLLNGRLPPVSRLYALSLRRWLSRHAPADDASSVVHRPPVSRGTTLHPSPEESISVALPAHLA